MLLQVDEKVSTNDFDAVVVCNGHYSEPRVPEIPGADTFPGQQLHTHNFRTNHDYRNKNVVIMGASASGQDIAREIAEVANKVKSLSCDLQAPFTICHIAEKLTMSCKRTG